MNYRFRSHLKKILASSVVAVLVCTSLPAFAAEIGADPESADEVVTEEEQINEMEVFEEDSAEEISAEESAVVISAEVSEDEQQQENDEGKEAEDETAALINYLIVDKPYVEPGETQYIVLSIGDGDVAISSAVLSYHRQSDGASYEVETVRIDDGGLLFEIDYPTESEAAVYILDSVSYIIDDVTYTVVFSEIGIDAKYGVAMEVETDPDGYLVDEDAEYETEIGVAAYDAEGNQISENSIGEAIAAESAQIPMTMAASSSGSVVVVLDPGHDSTHTGAYYSGLREETLNLKIAQYCKEELEQYQGVKVYMTRTTEACPYPGKDNSYDLQERVNYAASVGATVYVSLHLNANSSTSVSGSQVYCPNTNYNATVSKEGFALADLIMEQLNALGLENRGVYSYDSQSGDTYPDGSLADYYAVIRRSKLAGFPGIIVEHAFMSNTSDVKNYLSSEASLKSLGVADATGIANYFNLSKDNIVKLNGVWTYVVNGEPDYTYTGVAHNANGWWYVKNGVVDFTYDGFAENQNGKWYCENGKVTFTKQGILKDKTGGIGSKGDWYYVIDSKVQTSFTGLSNFSNENGWWYIKDGQVDFTHNGVDKNKNGWWYVTGGKVQFGFTGLADYRNANGWWYISDGKVDFTHSGVDKNKNGWWYISDGKVQFSYNGFASNKNGKWYIESGEVTFNKNSVIKDATGAIGTKNTWYYVVGSKVQTGFTGLANYKNGNGWWYIKNGVVDFTHNGVDKNKNGWWYVTDGKVQFGFTGLADYRNANGWWYIKGGAVDFTHNGVDKNKNGWWYVEDGKVQFSYNGIAENSNGLWYIKEGKVDFSYNGKVTISGHTYQIENGKVAN